MDYKTISDKIRDLTDRNADYVPGIKELIDLCKKICPYEDWSLIEIINHNKIKDDFEICFKKLAEELKSNKINGLYFGFSEISLDGTADNTTYSVEIGGAENCDFEDKDFEWSFDCRWYPDHISLESDELAKLKKIISRDNGLGNYAEYPAGLAFTVLIVNNLVRKYEKEINGRKIGVVAGFHDGDMFRLKGFNESVN